MQKTILSIGLAIFTFVFGVINSYSQDPNFHIYLCFGQSNMEGQGIIENQDRTVDSRFMVMEAIDCPNINRTAGNWYTATPPLCRCYTGLGPADYFGRTMLQNLPAEIKIGVVHVAVGGCKIELFDKYNYESYVATVEQWMLDVINEYGGNPYGKLVEIAKLAQKDGVIKGILMHQGESNTNEQDWPTKVKGVYDNLIVDLNLIPEQTPLLLGEVLQSTGNCCAAHNPIIAQVPNVIPNSHVISSDGLDGVDVAHFTSEAYRTLGVRYAEKMLTLLELNPDYPSVTITSPQNNSKFIAPVDVTITASASDPNGSVAKVEFYNGDVKIGETTAEPFSYKLIELTAGNYSITAVAIDNDNNRTTSQPIAITVNAPALEDTIIIKAKGVVGGESINLEIDGNVIQTWQLTTAYEEYSVIANVNGSIRVNYTNDNTDMDVQLDYIVVADSIYQAEDQYVNTAFYANGSCGGGNYSEYMHCNGYIAFATTPVVDLCPDDPNKIDPGICGCGIAEGMCNKIEIDLLKGWNIIGYPHEQSLSLDIALKSIWDFVDAIKDLDGYYLSGQPDYLNSLTKLDPGKGYFIKVTSDCKLSW